MANYCGVVEAHLPSLLWFILAVWVLVRFGPSLRELIALVLWRIKAGAAVKFSNFELGQVHISPQTKTPANMKNVRKDDVGEFYDLRKQFRDISIFLVHRVSPSSAKDQLYDILIFAVPGLRHGSLLGVISVEYYFGDYWDRNVYTSVDRSSGFSISTAAYAPFMCTARLHFNDGRSAIVHRYIDFEMGAVGRSSHES